MDLRRSWLALLIVSGTAFAAEKTRLIDGTAASVAKKLITVQDAYFYRGLQRFREGQPNVLVIEEGDELRHTVQKIVFEEMVYLEMKSFQVEGGWRDEVVKAIQLQRSKGHEKEWKEILNRFGRPESTCIDWILKGIQVERFLQKKVDTLTPVITEAEADRYYKQNEAKFNSNPYEKLKPSIILLLKKERLSKALEEWVRVLKDKYGVTNYLGT